MAGSVNKVILVGNLGKDPEIRTMQNGGRVASFSVATSEQWKDKASGERKERTEWHRIVVWNDGLVGIIERFVKKGSRLYLEGQLETRKWTDQSGADRYVTEVVLKAFRGEIVLLDRATDSGTDDGRSHGRGDERTASAGRSDSRSGGPNSTADDLDDEIPF